MDGHWGERAACLGQASELFFPEYESQAKIIAKAYCQDCPVKVECYEEALRTKALDGIWGGVWIRSRSGHKITSRKRLA